nr:MAG TPA: hypothetical protein [Caudoviricetes sp.]DAT42763.1 MAG TPA: hypothetical protein [Caudoviricetes sp.]
MRFARAILFGLLVRLRQPEKQCFVLKPCLPHRAECGVKMWLYWGDHRCSPITPSNLPPI